MENKPNLVLTAKDMRAGAKNPDRDFAVKFKADLITVLEYMIKNKKSLNIGLAEYEHKYRCKTYRCVCGWWAHWLDIPIMTKPIGVKYNNDITKKFNETICNSDIWKGFVGCPRYFGEQFFGDHRYGTLSQRLKLAKALEVA